MVLNVPDNYSTFWMYLPYDDDKASALYEGFHLLAGCDSIVRTFDQLLSYSMITHQDSFSIQRLAPNNWKMSFGQWGSWWSKNTLGNVSFENDSMQVRIDGIDAYITLKRPMPGLDFYLINKSQFFKIDSMQYEGESMLPQ